jgi:hypothetical protein
MEQDDGEMMFSDVRSRDTLNYMLRTVQQNYAQLTLLAEHKANIIVGACLVVTALITTNLSSETMFVGLVILCIFLLLSAAFAILALLPRLEGSEGGRITASNPLFFPFFSRMGLEQYMRHMQTLMKEDRLIYQAIVTDIHHHGSVLERKFRYLRYSYRILLWGIVLSLAAILAELPQRLGWLG